VAPGAAVTAEPVDEVGVHSGVTAVVDQDGAAPLTIQGFRKFIKDPAATRSRRC